MCLSDKGLKSFSLVFLSIFCVVSLSYAATPVSKDTPTESVTTKSASKPAPKPANEPKSTPKPAPKVAEKPKPAPKPAPKAAEKPKSPPKPTPKVAEKPKNTPESVQKTAEKTAKTVKKNTLPAGCIKLIEALKLSEIEIKEISDQLALLMQSLKGYKEAPPAGFDSLPEPPTGINGEKQISRTGEDGNYFIKFGYRKMITQPSQYWVSGLVISKNGGLNTNPDLEILETEIKKMIASLDKYRKGLTMKDLQTGIIELTHIDADNALTTLKKFGITTGAVSGTVEFEKLPYVVKFTDPVKDKDAKNTPSQLLVMFHPAHPEQFEQASKLIKAYADKPENKTKIPKDINPAKKPGAGQKTIVNKTLPEGSTKLIDLPKLNNIEIDEISQQLVLVMKSQKEYSSTSTAMTNSLLESPSKIIGERMISRKDKDKNYILRFGYRQFMTQPPKFWVLGVIIGNDGSLNVNPDLKLIEPEIKKLLASLNQMRGGLTVKDLTAKIIQLSYIDADNAISMLSGFGVTTGPIPPKVNFTVLPYVSKINDPVSTYTGLVGLVVPGNKGSIKGGSFGLSMSPGEATTMSENVIGTPLTQLLVMYHPAHPEQFSLVRKALDEYIDRPARQIFIEGMVLEISQNGLEELGVDWAWNSYSKEDGTPILNKLRGGTLHPGSDTDTFEAEIPNLSTFHNVFTGKFQWDWTVGLRALIREGKAQILSRPSVLTLNNRQSTIRVGKDVPIASSLQGNNTNSISAFKFQYLSTGILLNIRPRINESGDEVVMMIDTVVSAPVPNEDMELRSANGQVVLAKAPTVSTRRVQTYGRIPNNTPLIIGGLVANEKVSINDKVPLLGDIPIVGAAFRSKKTKTEKREVIIVLTPHVLPDQKEIRRSYPKDEDTFDSFGNELFRDSYRIRSEDVFDLTFLLENERIAAYRKLAREAASKNFRLIKAEPYQGFVKDSIPGEPILVTRMIYEVIKRLDVEEPVKQSRMIYFGSQQVGGYNVEFLNKLVKGKKANSVKDFGDKALALIFRYDYSSPGNQPIPEVKEIECKNRDQWQIKLWELNQPDKDGCERNTILIKDERDIRRLRRALTLKKIATLNGGSEHMRLKNFSVGKTLLMPELKKDQIHVIDSETAKFFFHTEHYYAAALNLIEEKLKQLDKELRRPEITSLLNSPIPDEVGPAVDEINKNKNVLKNDGTIKADEPKTKTSEDQDDLEAQIRELLKKRDKEKAKTK